MFRFIHTSDLHIGKRFGNMPEDLRGRLREARHTVIGRIATQARENGAKAIILAGDTFDTETPTPAILRQTLAAMRDQSALRWVLLPGNHDSLLADELWNSAQQSLPENVMLATTAEPIQFEQNVTLLPAPCTTRRPGRDLTEWMETAATPEGDLRIGIGHGPIQTFSEEGGASEIIAPDRPQQAGLDYLALGDWHGQMQIGERCWYSGTPEPDRFKHLAPGRALLVSLAGRGATPEVSPIETGQFNWRSADLSLFGGDDGIATLERLLPEASNRRQTLLRVVVEGRTRIADRSALIAAFEKAEPEFAYANLKTDGLVTECEMGDLDLIDHAGALRQAAEMLLAESIDSDLGVEERDIARDALLRLYSYCEAMQQ